MNPVRPATPRRLIVLQQHALAGRALGRCLAPLYGQTVVTCCPEQAEALLSTAGAPPTDLICGQRFADDEPLGSAWIARWRALSPCLQRVVLVTAEPAAALPDSDGLPGHGAADEIFHKPLDPAALRGFLAAGTRPAPPPPFGSRSRHHSHPPSRP